MSSFAQHKTPAGTFTVIVNDEHAVLASGWTDQVGQLVELVAPPLRPPQLEQVDSVGLASTALLAWLAGSLEALDDVDVIQHSGPFIQRAWTELRKVRPGSPVSYTDLAAAAGQPTAVRAAAQACARNPAALFVPCHRVLRNDGSLGGFRWGLDTKRWLLDHESSDGR